MIAYIEGVGWYPISRVYEDWRMKRPAQLTLAWNSYFHSRRFPLNAELVYVNEKTYYVGAECAANKKRREEKHEE